MVETERRKHSRHDLRVEAKVTTADRSLPVVMTNISQDGVQVECESVIPEGTEIVLSVQLAEETLLKGEVIWSLDTFVDEKMVYLIGMEIEAIVLPEIQAIGLADKAGMVQEIISWFSAHDSK